MADAAPGRGDGEALHHVAVVVADVARSTSFYAGLLGLEPDPARPHWMRCHGGGAIHLIERAPSAAAVAADPRAHVALAVASLEAARDRLLTAGLVPWQNGLDWNTRDIGDARCSLDWGLGTLFVRDPDGNAIEFVQQGRGIFAAAAARS